MKLNCTCPITSVHIYLTYTCLIYLFVATHSDHTGCAGFADGSHHVAGETLHPESKT